MFAIVHDALPDIIVETEEEMEEHLNTMPSWMAYEYVLVDQVWHVTRRWVSLGSDGLVYNESGTWGCPDSYLTYVLPNICPSCVCSSFMKGSICTLCNRIYGCPDCDKPACDCKCT